MRIPLLNRFTCNTRQLDSYINNFRNQNIKTIISYINENPKDKLQNFSENKRILTKLQNNTIALKLSSLDVYNNFNETIEQSRELCGIGIENNNKIVIDAEYYSIQDQINEISDILLSEFNRDKINIYKTYQLYRKDYWYIYKHDLEKERNYKIGFKIVRGAYYDTEKNNSWMHDSKEDTDIYYNKAIMSFYNFNKCYPGDKMICATHNNNSIDIGLSLKSKNIEFAQLMGMSDNKTNVIAQTSSVYKYIPYGDFSDTFPYLTRRLYENLSFYKYLFE